MSSFVHVTYPQQHPGVVRAERAVFLFQDTWRQARHGSLLLAAVVSALLVVVDQVIDTWSEGHLLAAWIMMWAVAFGAMALFAAPAREAARHLATAYGRWKVARIRAAEDRRLWELAQTDVRVMGDLQCAITRAGGIRLAE